MWDEEAARAKTAKSMAVPAAAEEDGGVPHLRSELGLSPKVPNMRLAASPSGLAVPVTPTRGAVPVTPTRGAGHPTCCSL